MSKALSVASILLNTISVLSGAADPTAGAGVIAPIGSKYWRSGTAGDYTKTGAGNAAWTLVPAGIYFNVVDYGATGDGVTDDRAAIQRAIDDAAVLGGCVYFPPGTYICGKNGANPYSFLLNAKSDIRFLGTGWGGAVLKQSGNAGTGAYSLFKLTGGCTAIEWELLTLDQSGLTNPGAGACHLFEVQEATYIKIVTCRLTGGVATAGSYVHLGGQVGKAVAQTWITDCDLREAGGPPITIDSGTSGVWITDGDIVQSAGDDDTVRIDATNGDAITDVKVLNCHLENGTKFAVRTVSSGGGILRRIQVSSNVVLGRVSLTNLDRSQFQGNNCNQSVAADANATIALSSSTDVQVQRNVILRSSTAAAGYLVLVDTCTGVMFTGNNYLQDVASSPLVHVVDSSNVQMAATPTKVTNAGATAIDAYLIEAANVAIDNIQLVGIQVAATAGTWRRAIRVSANGHNVSVTQINASILRNCDTGILFDDNGGGATRFPTFLQTAGNIIDAATADVVTPTGVFVRIGGNASGFGPQMYKGAGSPAGIVAAPVSSTYQRTDGGAGTTFYVKESGTGTAGWVGK